MQFNQALTDELNLILKFPSDSLLQGIKIHKDAGEEVVAAVQRLYEKGIVTQADGGYLTDLGHDLHARIEVVAQALNNTEAK
ncbi:TIGR02647 family protein [Glaciecola sp. XM2]|uniref:TIGR02647 family protein n=1 Tax=Glaciecola sp. XM2 TaxID=1914931 RepID=UPI001BDF4EC8|nr:TIGR02647 family protein [Glaciecola sp. XM2]MBT1451347.1 TIGR02647 family protein [Glaciecola sp. XM2]